MRIGLCTWSFTASHRQAGLRMDPLVPENLARMAVGNQLASIECGPGQFAGRSEAELDGFRESLAGNGLDLFIDTGWAEGPEDSSALRAALSLGHRLGARAVRTTISSLLEGDRRSLGLAGWQGRLQALVEPLRSLMPLAEEWGLPVGLENHQDACSWELVWVCERVGSPMLGVTMDVANALAVGETPEAFARRVLPYLKHVHLKDYAVHPTPSGYRLRRCALGHGVVDWPAMLALFDRGAPSVQGCIELGASTARHVRILEEDYWAAYPPRPLGEVINALRALQNAARPAAEEWRTPHEQGADAATCALYELRELAASVEYLRGLGPH
ncbi:MAG: sugar phosphate isomerase/epimerase [Candidatus Latescibacterota bacterium]